jgi:hypothetical protein
MDLLAIFSMVGQCHIEADTSRVLLEYSSQNRLSSGEPGFTPLGNWGHPSGSVAHGEKRIQSSWRCDMQTISLAFAGMLLIAGKRSVRRIPKIPTTTINSIRVNP